MARALGFSRIQPEVSLEDQLARFAPAALATSPAPITSSKYQFVNTMDFVHQANDLGWIVEAAGQRIAKDPDAAQYGRHMLKLYHPDHKMDNGDYFQLIISNAHNRMARFRADLGIFRLICTNGMIIKLNEQLSISETHRNTNPEVMLKAVHKAIEGVNSFAPNINAMQHRDMTADERFEFARQALTTRHEDDEVKGLPKAAILDFLKPVRSADNGDNLWVTYNVAQEKLISGQYMMHNRDKTKLRKQQTITSAEVDYKVNTELSDIALSWLA